MKYVAHSIDVEDWFHILQMQSAPKPEDWDSLPSRVSANLERLLGVYESTGIKTTCFFLGYVARRFPELVRRAASGGHEIASHGMNHQLVSDCGPDLFLAEAVESKRVLEDIVGTRVNGYRAAGFSITPATSWAFDAIAEAGYTYDSSIFPGSHQHGGFAGTPASPFPIQTRFGEIIEIPISNLDLFGRQLCMTGGGYFRLWPYPLIRAAIQHIQKQSTPVTCYLHPRDIDYAQPRLEMPFLRRFKSYVGLSRTETKLRKMLAEFGGDTFGNLAIHHSSGVQRPSLAHSGISTDL